MASYNDFKRPQGWEVKLVSSNNPWGLDSTVPDKLTFEGTGVSGDPASVVRKNGGTTPIGINCVFVSPNMVDVTHNVTGGLTYRISFTDNTPPVKDTLKCRQHPSGGHSWTTQEGG